MKKEDFIRSMRAVIRRVEQVGMGEIDDRFKENLSSICKSVIPLMQKEKKDRLNRRARERRAEAEKSAQRRILYWIGQGMTKEFLWHCFDSLEREYIWTERFKVWLREQGYELKDYRAEGSRHTCLHPINKEWVSPVDEHEALKRKLLSTGYWKQDEEGKWGPITKEEWMDDNERYRKSIRE